MHVHTSDTPAADLAQHIVRYLEEHTESSVLCFLAGGSALEIITHLSLTTHQKRRTIFCLGDERVSGEPDLNNFLQLTTRLRPEQQDWQIIDTCGSAQTPEEFSRRVSTQISKIISDADSIKILCVLGVGADGHTAGIFPMDLPSFSDTYTKDAPYVPVHGRGLTIDSRASLTPHWILEKADQILGYAVSESKCNHILTELIRRNYEINEMPAQIMKLHKDSYLFTDCTKLTDHSTGHTTTTSSV